MADQALSQLPTLSKRANTPHVVQSAPLSYRLMKLLGFGKHYKSFDLPSKNHEYDAKRSYEDYI